MPGSMVGSASSLPWTTRRGEWYIEIIGGEAPERTEYERQLAASGVPLAFGSRSEVDSLAEFPPAVFVSIRDARRVCVGGLTVRLRSAPLVPGHFVLRAERCAASIPLNAADAVVTALVEWVRSKRRVLRLSIDVFGFDPDHRHALGRVLERRGFRRAERPNGYADTIVIDLSDDEEAIFRSLHHSARRKVRQIQKLPLEVRPIDDAAFGGRMNDLLRETLERTGGRYQPRDWTGRIDLSIGSPGLSRIVGLFRSDTAGEDSLLAFAWGCHCGDHAFYSEAASTRDTGEMRAPLAYALMWDLIVWARRTGARWFDLGGITPGTHTDADPLGGISDFKRYFSQNVVRVREEYILDDHSWRASLVSAMHRRLRR